MPRFAHELRHLYRRDPALLKPSRLEKDWPQLLRACGVRIELGTISAHQTVSRCFWINQSGWMNLIAQQGKERLITVSQLAHLRRERGKDLHLTFEASGTLRLCGN